MELTQDDDFDRSYNFSENEIRKPVPIISCIMPVYNCEKYLKQSIQSILDQTFHDFELIIVNDGSTDSSLQIIEEMRLLDKRVIVLDQENKGVTMASNAGLEAARGAFIARMDADDISMPNRFKVQYDFLVANPDVVLAGGLAGTIDGQGTASGSAGTGNRHSVTDLLCFPPKIATAIHPLIMVRTEALKSIGGYSDHYRHAEDYEMFIRISRLGRIAHVDQHILDYRVHGENISVKNLDEQEKNAALAEIYNVKAARDGLWKGKLRISVQTFEAYVLIRILRRNLVLGILSNPMVYLRILGKIIEGAPKSESYTTGRLLLMAVFYGVKSIKAVRPRIRQFALSGAARLSEIGGTKAS